VVYATETDSAIADIVRFCLPLSTTGHRNGGNPACREALLRLAVLRVASMCAPVCHYKLSVFVLSLLLLIVGREGSGQQLFIHGNDIRFDVRPDRTVYHIGDTIVLRYTIRNISNRPLYVPATQFGSICGTPPHLWGQLEDSSGQQYPSGYLGSCLGGSSRNSVSGMLKDASLLGPGQSVRGSFRYESRALSDKLKPGRYRLKAVLFGWNSPLDEPQRKELAKVGAPFLTGESNALTFIEFRAPKE
jgi:hypothetical protein